MILGFLLDQPSPAPIVDLDRPGLNKQACIYKPGHMHSRSRSGSTWNTAVFSKEHLVDIAKAKERFRGPMIPVITNLNEDLSVDHGAIHENVRYVVDRGIICGSGVLLAVGAGGGASDVGKRA